MSVRPFFSTFEETVQDGDRNNRILSCAVGPTKAQVVRAAVPDAMAGYTRNLQTGISVLKARVIEVPVFMRNLLEAR
jgi:hypothetical protein